MNKDLMLQKYFDKYVTTWNPHDTHHRNISIHRPLHEDPRLLDSTKIFNANPLEDYEQLANRVQRHTRCSTNSCLWKKGSSYTCRYNAPWELKDHSKLFIDDKGQNKYECACNDDGLNVHNVPLLSMWRINVDFQLVISHHALLKYIEKYASKAKGDQKVIKIC